MVKTYQSIALFAAVMLMIAIGFNYPFGERYPYDTTDAAYDPASAAKVDSVLRDVILRKTVGATGERSGLIILTDCMTGLQYLTTRNGGLTPRLHRAGDQVYQECENPLNPKDKP